MGQGYQFKSRIGMLLAIGFCLSPGVFAETNAVSDAAPAVDASTSKATTTDKPKLSANAPTTGDIGAAANANEEAYASDQPAANPDPYEKFNRVMFTFNDKLDQFVLKPVATLYNKIVPKPLVKGISNIFSNIDTIPTVINDGLQGNIYQATSDAWRLGINSTIGILGFFDPATSMGLEHNSEDFGLTLAQWGYKNSNYLVLPFFGPSTPRDGLGLPVDYYLFSIYPYITPVTARYELYGLGIVSRRADLLHFQSVMEQASLDRYVFLRDAYMQRRSYLIQRNKELGDPYLEKNSKNESGAAL
jgi:phospholipid-binding lipoprotein MlaA